MPMSFRSASIALFAATISSASWLAAAAPELGNRQEGKGGAQTAGDACLLLTKEDAVAALGGPVGTPNALTNRPAGPDATVSSCDYAGSGYHSIHFNIRRLPASAVQMYKARCAQQGKEGLAGLGDLACWYNAEHEELHALKGSAFISIQLRGSSTPTEAIKAAMKKALERVK